MSGLRTNLEFAAAFRQLADLLEIAGESVFRVNAFRKAADTIEGWPEPVTSVLERGALDEIPGVGKGIAAGIQELATAGELAATHELSQQFPVSLTELLAVPDIGPKRARQLHDALGVKSLEELKAAVQAGRLADVPGLGAKNAQRIVEGLAAMREDDGRMPLPLAWRLGQELATALRSACPSIEQIEVAGSIRRFRDTIGDIDIVTSAPDPAPVLAAFVALPNVERVEMQGENRARIQLHGGGAADVRVAPAAQWGSLLHHFTGSKEHNIEMRALANDRGWTLNEYGFRRGDELVSCATEAEVFAFLDLAFVPPPMREGIGEVRLAREHKLPRVVELGDVRGDVHCHSTWSDGRNSVLEMATAARDRGYAYVCITDHSSGLGVTQGVDADGLRRQREEILAANEALAPFRVLQGIEVEVMADGRLDLADEVLAELDLVIASVHTGTRRGKEATTKRALAAIHHPLVDILAHPTARVLGERGPGDFDVAALIAAAAETGTALEINGSRVDLSDSEAKAAAEAGCLISFGSDAHAINGFAEMLFSVGTAQRGWVPFDQILNTLPLEKMLARLKRNRG